MIVVYGSRYGHAKRYAEEFAKLTGVRAVPCKEVKRIEESAVYFGAVYAGNIKGLASAARRTDAAKAEFFAVVAVGLTDSADAATQNALQRAALAAFPAPLQKKLKMFYLRGGIDYAKLSAPHRFLMKLMYAAEKKTPPEKRSAQAAAIVETYGTCSDFYDETAAKRLAAELLPQR